MRQLFFTLASLTPEQEQALKELEARLGQEVALLAFRRGAVGMANLTNEQAAELEEVERKLGLTILAVEPK